MLSVSAILISEETSITSLARNTKCIGTAYPHIRGLIILKKEDLHAQCAALDKGYNSSNPRHNMHDVIDDDDIKK